MHSHNYCSNLTEQLLILGYNKIKYVIVTHQYVILIPMHNKLNYSQNFIIMIVIFTMMITIVDLLNILLLKHCEISGTVLGCILYNSRKFFGKLAHNYFIVNKFI